MYMYVCTRILLFLDRWAAKLGNQELTEQILKDSKCEVNYIDRETGMGAQAFFLSSVPQIALITLVIV